MPLSPRNPGTLASRSTIRGMLGVSKQRIAQLTAEPDFPRPVDVLEDGRLPIWRRADIEAYRDARIDRAEGEGRR